MNIKKLNKKLNEVLNPVEIVNLTPHTITIINGENKIILESKGLARVDSKTEQIDEINGIPVNKVSFGNVTGLPNEQNNTIYIVSKIVADVVKDTRDDCYIVDKTVRDSSGNIIGCAALAKV